MMSERWSGRGGERAKEGEVNYHESGQPFWERREGDEGSRLEETDRVRREEEEVEVVKFYRRKFDEFSQEHQAILDRIEQLKVDHATSYKLNWELTQRGEEVVKLQRVLSHSQSLLVEEQRKGLKVLTELDRLKVKEVEDRDYISQLVDTIKNGRSSPPSLFPSYRAPSSLSSSSSATHSDLSDLNQTKLENKHLKLKVLALEAQLQDQVNGYSQMYQALNEDLQAKAEEERLRQEAYREEFSRLQRDIDKHKAITISNLSEMVELRRQAKLLELREMELELQYKQKLAKLQTERPSQERSQQSPYSKEYALPEKSSIWAWGRIRTSQPSRHPPTTSSKDTCNNISHKRLSECLKARERELTDIKIRLASEKEEHDRHLQGLQDQLTLLKKRSTHQDQTSRFAFEGYYYDMKEIQSHAKSLEHHLLRSPPSAPADLAPLKLAQTIYRKATTVVTRMQI